MGKNNQIDEIPDADKKLEPVHIYSVNDGKIIASNKGGVSGSTSGALYEPNSEEKIMELETNY